MIEPRDAEQLHHEQPEERAQPDPLQAGAALGMDGGAVGAVLGTDVLAGRGEPAAEDAPPQALPGTVTGTDPRDEPLEANPAAPLRR